MTYRYRVKNLAGELNRQARAVNFVWNHCNEQQRRAVSWGRKWLTAYDLQNLCAGSSRGLGLLASTIIAVAHRYVESRRQHNRPWLAWRGKKSLGWVPLRLDYAVHDRDRFKIGGKWYRVFYSRPIPDGGKIVERGSFAQDSLGRWYLNIPVEVPDAPLREPTAAVGIDLGLKDLATLSTGERIANERVTARYAEELATAQRARKRRRVTAIQAKIGAVRRDAIHKATTSIVRRFDTIFVGGVSASGLAQTSMGKSVLDASWSEFRRQIAYKAVGHGARYAEVDERLTTQTCSDCGLIGGPKGREGLVMRQWTCACGSVHDRDVNAARNIARLGRQALEEGVRV